MKFNSMVLSFKNQQLFKNKNLILAFACICIGLLLGVFGYILSAESDVKDLFDFIGEFNTEFSDKSKLEIISGIALSGLPYFFVMFVVGGSIFGRILCPVITAVKSMGISIIVSYLYCNMGLKGLEYALLVFFPGKTVLLFTLLLLTVTSTEMSKELICGNKADLSRKIKSYVMKCTAIVFLLLLSWIIDFLCYCIFSGLF